jgi:hypothetical protein
VCAAAGVREGSSVSVWCAEGDKRIYKYRVWIPLVIGKNNRMPAIIHRVVEKGGGGAHES